MNKVMTTQTKAPGIPPKSLALKAEVVKASDRAAGESAVIGRAIDVIGDESQAMRWLGTPVRALDYATPISLLHRPKGREAVLTVLGRLEHGVL